LDPKLVINAVKKDPSTDKIQDKIIQKGLIDKAAREKYGSKMSKAVVNYSIGEVFGNSLFNKSDATPLIKNELDVANLLAKYMTSGKVNKEPQKSIDQNQQYTDKRATAKNDIETTNIKAHEKALDDARNKLYDITVQKEAAENRELAEVIEIIDGIT